MLEKGWLEKGFRRTEEQVKQWPDWMRRAAGLSVETGELDIKPEPETEQRPAKRGK